MRNVVAAATVLALALGNAYAQGVSEAPAETSKPAIVQSDASDASEAAIKVKPDAAESAQAAPQTSAPSPSPSQTPTNSETASAATSKQPEPQSERAS